MESLLHLCDGTREIMIRRLKLYVDTYKNRVSVVFGDIEKEADDFADKYYNDILNQTADYDQLDSICSADVAQQAIEIGWDYYQDLNLMKYILRLTWIAILYQFWEQQVRKFLYREVNRYGDIEFKKFCTRIDDIKECFKKHNVEIEKLQSWQLLEELRLVCNVIKHGDGSAARKLQELSRISILEKELAILICWTYIIQHY